MARQCEVTGKKRQVGNNVSHAKNRTKRTFLPNTRSLSFISDLLKRSFKLKVSTHGLRSINHKGGIDSFVLNSKNKNLTKATQAVKKAILKKFPKIIEEKFAEKTIKKVFVSARKQRRLAQKDV